MAQTTTLELLPKELIAHIAAFCDATSVLQSSRTCRTIRAASYDALVFKEILIASQLNNWDADTLDIDAISTRAAGNPEIWARYAVADQRAWHSQESSWVLRGPGSPLIRKPQDFVSYLPELHVVKHPHLQNNLWKTQLCLMPRDQTPSVRFCVVMALLDPDGSKSYPDMEQPVLRESQLFQSNTTAAILHASISAVVTLRRALRTSLRAWPFNFAANVPHIALPTAAQIPLRPLNDNYQLPVPFSRRAVELLGNSKTSFSNWDSWYDLHNLAAFRSDAYLTSGTWCGYYTYTHTGSPMVDPPMLNIRFTMVSSPDRDSVTGDEVVELRAADAHDGHGKFELSGTMSYTNRSVRLKARKRYVDSGTSWDWDCQLTPFGIVGFWGTGELRRNGPSRQGIVWLWKQEWTEAA
ncbi:hypothetical protein LTR09_005536 [Extremus antarcticus]|uniref:F-box domain-containing protein n=1 Tax=Extremus antarcticus TaxID=702011 RepID=A0AAJ0DG03_9PEZI|nr:hypothetical protein LTR09_005536 [Extremus antarcticus]